MPKKGQKMTAEQRAQVSAHMRRYWKKKKRSGYSPSAEQRQKMREGMLRYWERRKRQEVIRAAAEQQQRGVMSRLRRILK